MQSTRKNASMQSTAYMSNHAKSHGSNFFNPQKKWIQQNYSYANVPLPKQTPNWNQSSATWRYTSPKYAFSKDKRFKINKSYYLDIIEPQIKSTRTSISCTFGKDVKKPISTVILRNASQKPSPDRYHLQQIDQQSRKKSKGKTFGLSWGKYQRVHIDHRKDVYSAHLNEYNPPAKYEVRQVPGQRKNKYTAYGRLKMYTQKMSDLMKNVPGSVHLVKDRHLYGMNGLNERNFSVDQRIDLTKPINNYPGSKYKIPGFCDKFDEIKKKLDLQQ